MTIRNKNAIIPIAAQRQETSIGLIIAAKDVPVPL